MVQRDCQHDPSNALNQCTIAVVKGGAVVSHLPKRPSHTHVSTPCLSEGAVRFTPTWQEGDGTLVT